MSDAADLRRRRFSWRKKRAARSRTGTMSVIEHLGELRSRLIKSAVAFLAVSVVAFIFFEPISDFLLRPLCRLPRALLGEQGCELTTFSPLEPFTVRLKVTAMVGLAGASPVWLYQLWAFIVPALTSRERRYAFPFVASSVVLFLAGGAFAYVTLPRALEFLVAVGGSNLQPLMRAQEYLNFVALMLIIFGITFEVPLLLFFLGLAGAVTPEQLRKQRRAAIVVITILAAVVTPSQDPYTMLGMALPLYLFYELTILLLSVVLRNRRKDRSARPV